MKKTEGRITRRERLALATAVLIPVATERLGGLAEQAGRLMWVVPLAVLPLGILIGKGWARLGAQTLSVGLERTFGKRVGWWVKWLYALWGIYLLGERAWAYGERLTAAARAENTGWFYLLVGLLLCLWLREKGGDALARAGTLLCFGTEAILGAVLLLCLPKMELGQILPRWTDMGNGFLRAAAETASLAGYGVYALGLPVRDGEHYIKVGSRTARWCGGYAALALAAAGTLGAGLTAELSDPFFRLTQGTMEMGVGGEAIALAVLTLCDWAGLALLCLGCESLWRELFGRRRGFGVVIGAVFLAAGLLAKGGSAGFGRERWTVWGNLTVGALIPLFTLVAGRGKAKTANGTKYGTDEERKDNI